MSITIGGNAKRLGLALSGGGFRAAAFHLGMFQKLAALGLLDKVDVLSCVSGGSIAGAFLAKNWKRRQQALAELHTYLATRSIAASSVIGGMFDPFHSRLDKLADSYDRDLFRGATLADLRDGPRLYVNTTNLATGNLFFFVTGERGKSEMGEHELTREPADAVALSRAVAASSAFPPVFPPLRLDHDIYGGKGTVEYVTLTDGGVYDNLGINPLLSPRNALDYIIVSDAGAPFQLDDTPAESGAGVVAALIPLMMEQIRGLQFDRMLFRHKAKAGPKPLWFSIDSPLGQVNPGDAELASRVGTNLKALSSGEMTLLIRHAAALLEERLNAHAPELLNQE